MDYDTVLIRYGEIFLKSDYVRRAFTDRLIRNLHHALKSDGIGAEVFMKRHRVILRSPDAEAAAQRAAKVFGVISTSPAVEASSEMGALTEAAVEYAGKALGSGSFAVRARRSKDYPVESREVERALGGALKGRYGNQVDLTNPKTTIGVEIHGGDAYVFSQTLEGVGGLPYGTQGALAAKVDDERSALAAWMMMRRGCSLWLVGPSAYREALEYYADSPLKDFRGLGDALSAGALGVVSPQGLGDLDFSKDGGLRVPTYRPLCGMDAQWIKDMLSSSHVFISDSTEDLCINAEDECESAESES